jgi:hypothetical protein
MSFFGEEDAFSFLHDNYRDRSDDDESDDDESDASSSDGEEDDEQSCTYVGVAPQSPVSVPDSPCDNQGDESQEDSDGEPSPWKGSKAKKRIITELKNDNSTIHSMEVKEVHRTFASRYVLRLFKATYKRLLEHLKAKTGPFEEAKQQEQQDVEEEEPTVVKWYTQGKISPGYSLLYSLLMESEGTGIENMTVHDIWQSHAAFRCYDFQSFQGYYTKMKALVKKHRKIVMQDEADFQHDMDLIPEKSHDVWYKHPAKELLKKDVKDGVASLKGPQDLRKMRIEYQDFSVTKFCKEVHHEKQRQRAKPFWQWFRNKEAREMHEREVNELRTQWINDNDQEVNQLRADLVSKWTPYRRKEGRGYS